MKLVCEHVGGINIDWDFLLIMSSFYIPASHKLRNCM